MNPEYAEETLKQQRREVERLREQRGETSELDESQQDSSGSLSSHDQHPGDSGTTTFERSKDMSVLEDLENRLSSIDAALDRIEEGTYGKCEVCGQPIDEERLGALPTARYCRQHREEAEEERPHEHGMGMDASLRDES